MILVTGASGNAGGAVLQAALARQLPVRAMYRSQGEAQRAPPGVAVAVADFADKSSLPPALHGIELVYLVCGPVPQLIDLESNMIEACLTAGIQHIALNSALGAGRYQKSFPSWHGQVEAKLQATGLNYTIVRPNGFMQNIVAFYAASIRAEQAFYAAQGDGKTSIIDVRDVGAAIANILHAPAAHAGKIYELTGPEAFSNAEIAARIAHVAGVKVSYVDIPEDAQRQAMLGNGMPEWQVAALLELQEYYRSGACAGVDDALVQLLGQPPRTLDAYLNENAAAFRSQPH